MQRSPLLAPVRFAGTLSLGQTVTLDDVAVAGLTFREVNVSEAFTLVDEEGRFYRASRKAPTQALVYESFDVAPESPAQITLFCAILGRQRMILVTQKAAELGCDAMVPVVSAHSVQRGPTLEKEKPWAWRGQSLKGSRQCRRGSVMQVHEPMDLGKVLTLPAWTEANARFFLDDRGEGVKLDELRAGAGTYALMVGPEGGFSDPERAMLLAAKGKSLRLGGRVLRAETAVFAGLSVLQHRLGDLR